MKKAIVTGATSFLGSALIRQLLEQNYDVTAVVRKNSPNLYRIQEKDMNKVHMVELSLAEIERLPEFISEGDVFFHFGWDGSGSRGRQDVQVQAQNFEYSINALNVASKIGCKTFVFPGSQAEYGRCDEKISEIQTCEPTSEYGKQKYAFGKAGFKRAVELGINFIHMRIFSVYGYGDRPGTLVDSCVNVFEKGGTIELGKCTQKWNYLYIDDFAKMAVELAQTEEIFDTEEASVFNVGGLDTKPLKDFVQDIYKVSSKRGNCRFGVRAENAEGSPSINPDTTKLFQHIAYRPKYSFKQGIEIIMEKKYGKKCIVCGTRLSETPLLSFHNMPASAQDIPDADEAAREHAVDLELHQCSMCGLVQFACEPVAYYKDVIRSGGFTTTMVELRRKQYSHLIEHYQLTGKKILEVGCGRGEFLGVLKEFDVQAYGIENKKDLVKIACDSGLNVMQGFITDEVNPVAAAGPYAAFLSFNFLEHQPDPNAMLKCIYENLEDEGVGLVTVPSLEYILKYNGYYEFIRDHIAYYTFDTLRFVLNKNGFDVIEEELINRDTLSVIVRKRKKMELGTILTSYENIKEQFEKLLDGYQKAGKRVALWGASHQGFTIASSLKLNGKIEYIVDSAPFKQNKYAPASHIRIVSPEIFQQDTVSAVIIVAPGYSDEIKNRIQELYTGRKIDIYTLRTNQIEKL